MGEGHICMDDRDFPKQCYFIDKKGEIAIKGYFLRAGDFRGGIAQVAKESYLLVPIFGKIMEILRDKGYSSLNDKILKKVQKYVSPSIREPKFGYIDKTGKYIWEPTN
jgi:hypothetical protein